MKPAFFIVALVLLMMLVSILHPLGRAYLAGLALARDPSVRATPLQPWVVFDLGFMRSLRRSWLKLTASGLILTLVAIAHAWRVQGWDCGITFLADLMILAGLLMTMHMACMVWAPVSRSLWWLVAAAGATVLFLYPLFLLTAGMFSVSFLETSGWSRYSLLSGLLAAFFSWSFYAWLRQIHRRDTVWFLFTE